MYCRVLPRFPEGSTRAGGFALGENVDMSTTTVCDAFSRQRPTGYSDLTMRPDHQIGSCSGCSSMPSLRPADTLINNTAVPSRSPQPCRPPVFYQDSSPSVDAREVCDYNIFVPPHRITNAGGHWTWFKYDVNHSLTERIAGENLCHPGCQSQPTRGWV